MTVPSAFPLVLANSPISGQEALNTVLRILYNEVSPASGGIFSNAVLNSPKINGAINPTISGTLVVTGSSITAASPAASSIINDSALSMNRAGTISASGNSFYAARGIVTITNGTTVKEAFIAGGRFGISLAGTMDQTSATRLMAVFAKIDASAGAITAGQLSAIWADMGASAPSGGWSTETNAIRLQNTTGSEINSLLYGYGKASYMADLSANGSNWSAAAGGAPLTAGADRVIKINLDGVTGYLPVYNANS